MNRFEPGITNNFYPDLQIDGERHPITGDRYHKPDFTQSGNDAAEESIHFATRESFLGPSLCDADRSETRSAHPYRQSRAS